MVSRRFRQAGVRYAEPQVSGLSYAFTMREIVPRKEEIRPRDTALTDLPNSSARDRVLGTIIGPLLAVGLLVLVLTLFG